MRRLWLAAMAGMALAGAQELKFEVAVVKLAPVQQVLTGAALGQSRHHARGARL